MNYRTATVADAILDIASSGWVSTFDIFHELRGRTSYAGVQDNLQRLVEQGSLFKRQDIDSKERPTSNNAQPAHDWENIITPRRDRRSGLCPHCGRPAKSLAMG